MHNFLKVLLLGTVLIGSYSFAQAPGYAAAWSAATRSGYGNDSAKLGFSPPGAAGSAANSASSNLMVLSPEEAALTGATHYDVAADKFVTIVNEDSLGTVAQSTGNLRGLSTAEAALTGSTHVDVSTGEFSTHVGGAGAATDNFSYAPGYEEAMKAIGTPIDGGASAGAGAGGSGGAGNVSRWSGEKLFNSLDKDAQEALYSQFSNAGITAKDLTQGMVTAVENGSSLTTAVAAQTAANAAAAQVARSIIASDPAISNAVSTAIKDLGNSASLSEITSRATTILGGPKSAEVAVQKALNAGSDKITNAATKAAAEKLGDGAGDAAKQMGEGAAKQTMEQMGKETDKAIEAAVAEQVVNAVVPYKVVHFNYLEYALLIAEALKGNEIDDATKEVTVKGAEPMQQSQGSQGGGASVAPLPSSEMAGTTIAGAASAMATLLNLGKIDLSLLSTDIEKPKEDEKKRAPAVRASSSASQADVSASEVQVQSESQAKKMNTQEQREIMHRRALLLSEWATAALQIGEGSNAISSDFYARAAGFGAAASGAQGSMGGINTITDSDRFVLFELTRGAALSAVQLGLQGAENLNALDEVMEEPAPARTPGISASTSSSQ